MQNLLYSITRSCVEQTQQALDDIELYIDMRTPLEEFGEDRKRSILADELSVLQ
jgi:hypothetical protein